MDSFCCKESPHSPHNEGEKALFALDFVKNIASVELDFYDFFVKK